jgi:serine/threonine-protein kinase RsbW
MPHASKTFPAVLESLADISAFVNDATHLCKMTEREAWHVQLAVDEAATNIIQHAYGESGEGTLDLSWDIDAGVLTIILRDQGTPFEPAAVPVPDIHSSFEERQAGGLGIYLMNKLMDDVEYRFAVGSNELTLRKRFAEPTVASEQLFVIDGRLDARGTAVALEPVSAAVAAGARTVLLDMHRVSFLSSSGLRTLLMIRRELNAHQGTLMLVGMLPHIEEVFTMTGFSQVFELYPTVEAARAALRARGE